jgi:AcrR family transcriptional regulator
MACNSDGLSLPAPGSSRSITNLGRARVTKGALYHHFANKLELYRAVVEDMERELVVQMAQAADTARQPQKKLETACRAYLDACLDSSLTRILVLEAPVVLGWKEWCALAHQREIAALAGSAERVRAAATRARGAASPAQHTR